MENEDGLRLICQLGKSNFYNKGYIHIYGAANLHPPKNIKVQVSKLHPLVIDKNTLNISFKTTTLMLGITVTCFLFYFQIFYFFKYTTVLSDSCSIVVPHSCNFHKFTNNNHNHFSFVESLSTRKLGIVVYR